MTYSVEQLPHHLEIVGSRLLTSNFFQNVLNFYWTYFTSISVFVVKEAHTVWPINIRFGYLEDFYGKSVVIVLETLPYDDNIGLKKLRIIIDHF